MGLCEDGTGNERAGIYGAGKAQDTRREQDVEREQEEQDVD
jgi:hypothetical protein